MPALRSRTSTHGRNMAGARGLWRATGMRNGDFGKPIVAVVNSFTQFVPGHVHLKDLGQMVAREIEDRGFPRGQLVLATGSRARGRDAAPCAWAARGRSDMNEESYRRRLTADLDKWVAAGLLNPAQRDPILQSLPPQNERPAASILAWAGSVLAGLAGAIEVAGRTAYVTLDMSPGYGYTGIVVAMLAGLNPLGVIAAAVFVAGVLVGADSMSRAIGVPTYIADVIVATSLLSVLVATLLTQYRVRWK